MQKEIDVSGVIDSLSPIERAILPYIKEKDIGKIAEKSGLNKAGVLRAIEFLSNKKIINLKFEEKNMIFLGNNGLVYIQHGLPERKLLHLIDSKKTVALSNGAKESRLNEHEFKAALGALKRKALINIEHGKIMLVAKKEEITKKMLEESLLDTLPREFESLAPEEKFAYQQLLARKDIVRAEKVSVPKFILTEIGEKLIKSDLKKAGDLIEELTPAILRGEKWRGKKFRKYDVESPVPQIYGGKRQPYLEFLQDVKHKLVALGFEEASGELVESEFWNFDALFQPQFHVARDWSSTYFVKNKMPDEKIDKNTIESVKKQHEASWMYKWDEKKAKNRILRPQGTVLSARELASNITKLKIPGKYFSIARCYRPDVVDATHLSEFNQVEGIIVKEGLTLKNLFSILEMFAREIAGAKEVAFRPSYFPFTEPSVELFVKHEKFGWIELGGAGIFRRELVKSLVGKDITVLAWGLGIDRLAMMKLGVNDIRELFSYDLDFLRKGLKNKQQEKEKK
jgi:phenylalanyl-tRNA synthetase alpha chain